MATKIKNLEYDAQIEVGYWKHPAEQLAIPEVENGTIYTTAVYTDGSKIGDNVGAARITFENGKLVHEMKFELHGHCSNYQTKQFAILKVLEN